MSALPAAALAESIHNVNFQPSSDTEIVDWQFALHHLLRLLERVSRGV